MGQERPKKEDTQPMFLDFSVILAFFVKYWIILPVCVSNSYLNEINWEAKNVWSRWFNLWQTILFYKHKIFPSEFKQKYKAVLKGNTQIPQNWVHAYLELVSTTAANVLHLISSRLWHLVPPARPQQLWVEALRGGSTEACNAVWHRKRSRGEKRSIRSVPYSCGVSPQ